MFNLSGSELIFLVLIALVVLGPDKLPEAMRRAGKAYADFKKMTTGFQSEMKSVLEEPMRELRETADLAKKAAMFDVNPQAEKPVSGRMADLTPAPTATSSQPVIPPAARAESANATEAVESTGAAAAAQAAQAVEAAGAAERRRLERVRAQNLGYATGPFPVADTPVQPVVPPAAEASAEPTVESTIAALDSPTAGNGATVAEAPETPALVSSDSADTHGEMPAAGEVSG